MSEQDSTLIDLSGDRGVLKKILQEGTSEDVPTSGCKVSLHYTGTLENATKFDSSLDRNEPFEFELGKGSVIKAFDLGISSMKKGEKAILTCAPEYAYGESGSPPNIGPNATLIFEIELLDWKPEDLSPRNDGHIFRHVIKKGLSRKTPNDGASVSVHIVGKYNDRIFDDREVKFNIGEVPDDEVISGIQHSLTHFVKGETSRLVISPKYAFGEKGNTAFGIPKDATVEYTVTLIDFEREPQSWKLDAEESLNQAKILKDKATDFTKREKYELAVKIFEKSNNYLSNCTKTNGGEDEPIKLKAAVFANIALCQLKLQNFLEARKACDTVLELDPKNVKAYYRRGQSFMEMREPKAALKDFQKVIEFEPDNKAAHNQIVKCNHEIQNQESREKQLYSKMFNKYSEKTEDQDNEKKEELACGEWNNDFVELNGGGLNGADAKAQADQVLDDVNRNVVMIN